MAAYDTGAGASKTNKLQMFFFIVKTQLNHNQVEVGLTTLWVSNPPTTTQWNYVLLLFKSAVVSNTTQTNHIIPK